MSVRLIFADDHLMVREGLKKLLELDGDIQVVAEADDGEECLEKIKQVEADILLLDIGMPKKNGLEVLDCVKKENVDMKVLVLTEHYESEYLFRAIDLGVEGYLLKQSKFEELKRAVYTIAGGEKYIQPDLVPMLDAKQKEKVEDHKRVDSLTRRELEVLRLLAVGMYNKEIAETLHISERTVKNHVSNIFKKLEVADRTQAAIFAIRNELICIL